MDLRLTEQVALITGAGSGIGRRIALILAEEGVDVCVNDIDLEKAEEVAREVSGMGRRSLAIKADVTNFGEVEVMVNRVTGEWGRVDVLVNNAGWSMDTPHFADSSREANWEPTINLSLYGVMNCSRAVIQQMISRKSGKIVSVVSDAARVGEPNLASYSAAKAGVVAFSKALAKDVGKYCINVNCVSPGGTRTEGTQALWDKMRQEMGNAAFEERQRKVRGAYPIARGLNRIAEPEDIANAVVFLCSDRAVFITGQTISVSGGYSML